MAATLFIRATTVLLHEFHAKEDYNLGRVYNKVLQGPKVERVNKSLS